MNFTIVSVPFPFKDNQLTIDHQHNAIKSWTLLDPRPEIVLLGYEYGIAEVAQEYGCIHVPGIGTNELGHLSMKSIFKQIAQHATNDWIAYLDTDAILLDDFLPMVDYCTSRWENCLVCAGRWDANLPNRIKFSDPNWQKYVLNAVYKEGKKGSDYFIYRKGFYQHIPDFSIGKGAWDGWMIGAALEQKIPVVNVTQACHVVHQKHGMRWSKSIATGRNKRLCGKTEAWINNSTIFLKKGDIAKS